MKVPKKRRMKKLGTGYIKFWSTIKDLAGYQHVSLSTKAGDAVRLRPGLLGPWKRVRLWAEVLE